MKIADIEFKDEAFKACVVATGFENAEEIVELRCRKQKITDVSGIEYLTGLKLVDLTRNSLTSVDLSKNINLEEIFLGNNAIEHLDVSGCTKLVHLEVFMNDLEQLDLSNNKDIEDLWADLNDLEQLDVSGMTELFDLRVNNNNLKDIDLSGNPKLEKVYLKENPLSEQSVASLNALSLKALQV